MKDKEIRQLIMIVRSCKNNLNSKYNGEFDKQVSEVCNKFCRDHNINITHGSAYKELRHKSYYYINKCIDSIIYEFTDLYDLYKNNIVSSKDIVDKMLKIGGNR